MNTLPVQEINPPRFEQQVLVARVLKLKDWTLLNPEGSEISGSNAQGFLRQVTERETEGPSECARAKKTEEWSAARARVDPYRIQVVEDEGIVALDLRHTLQRLGYVVTGIAASGEQAIKQVTETPPDLILMDVSLKGEMSGIEAAKKIRTKLNVPIIFVTAFRDDATVAEVSKTENAGLLFKPFVGHELEAAIRVAIGSSGQL